MNSQNQLDLNIRVAGKTLKNPVCVASGTFGFGDEHGDLTDIGALGAIFTKAITPESREGNRTPRLAETPAGLINAIGLANPGIQGFLQSKEPVLRDLQCPAIVNVAGSTLSDYIAVAQTMEDSQPVWGIELNVSCPNVDHGGMAFGTDPKVLYQLVQSIRKVISKPLIVKLSPNVTDISILAKAAADAGADALSCINTLTGMKIDIDRRQPVIPRGTGGLSGPAIRPVGVAAVWKVAKAVNIPIFGIGGIAGPSDAIEYLLAGASAIQVGTALFSEPNLPSVILEGIQKYMRQNGFQHIADFHNFF